MNIFFKNMIDFFKLKAKAALQFASKILNKLTFESWRNWKDENSFNL